MWQKKGLVYKPDGSLAHSRSHAQVPYAYKHEDFLRVYFSSRDDNGYSRPTFIDVDYGDPSKILYIHDTFVLDLGGPGEYDETGAMPSWFVPQANGDIWLYYTGWNRTHNSYRLSMIFFMQLVVRAFFMMMAFSRCIILIVIRVITVPTEIKVIEWAMPNR